MKKIRTLLLVTAALNLSACSTAGKVVTAPFKVAAKTGELAGKAVYHTGRIAVKGTAKTGELAAKSVYYTGKGALAVGTQLYYIGRIPVQITDKALDTTTKILTITTQVVDLTGKVATVSKQIKSVQLDAELKALKNAKNIVSVLVDAF